MHIRKVIVGVGVAWFWLLVIAGSSSLVYGISEAFEVRNYQGESADPSLSRDPRLSILGEPLICGGLHLQEGFRLAEIKDSPVPSVDRSLQVAALAGAGDTSTIRLGKDLSLTVGVETWGNEWQTWWGSRSGVARHFESISAFDIGLIPTATLVYKKFFVSGSFMWTPDYDFGTRSDLTLAGEELKGVGLHKINLKSSRQEGDLTVGYFPLDWLGVAIGYKGILQDYHEDVISIDLSDQSRESTSSSSKSYFNGPIFGVMGSARIEERFTLIGNAFGGYLVARCSPSCDEPGNKAEHGSYVASKIVMRYAPTPKLSLTLGYRLQVVHTTFDGGAGFTSRTGIDLTHGPVISVNYRF